MAQYPLIVASAFALAATITPLVRYLAAKLGIVDRPSSRKVHIRPIPLMGGVAIYVAFIVALAVFGDRSFVRETAGILLGATLCSFMGTGPQRGWRESR